MTTIGPVPVWNLSVLYKSPNDPQLAADLRGLAREAEVLRARTDGKLKRLGGKAYAAVIDAFEDLSEAYWKPFAYTGLLHYSDTRSFDAKRAFFQTFEGICFAYEGLTHITHDAVTMDKARERRLAGSPEFKKTLPLLRSFQVGKDYELSLDAEIAEVRQWSHGTVIWGYHAHEELSQAVYPLVGKNVPDAEIRALLQSPNASVREAAGKARVEGSKPLATPMANILNDQMHAKLGEDRARGYEHVLTSSALSEAILAESVQYMMGVVNRTLPQTMHRFMAMKAKFLGVKKLQHWDYLAPFTRSNSEHGLTYSWNEGAAITARSAHTFGPEFERAVVRHFENEQIHAVPQGAKEPSAYAWPLYGRGAFISMHYNGTPECVSTLGHECGHGGYFKLSDAQRPLHSYGPTSFHETVAAMTERCSLGLMIESCKDKAIAAQLSGYRTQILFDFLRHGGNFNFEIELYGLRQRKGLIAPEQFGQLWLKHRRALLGPSVVVDDAQAVTWAREPHLYATDFYNHPYVTAALLVVLLEQQQKDNPAKFSQTYNTVLKEGGSISLQTAAQRFGINVNAWQTWHKAVRLIGNELDGLETTLKCASRLPTPRVTPAPV